VLEVKEVRVAVGDEVVVEALFRMAPVPPGVGPSGGYRTRPTCMQATPASSTPIRVTPTSDAHVAKMERRGGTRH
jgi:hypothetical protein